MILYREEDDEGLIKVTRVDYPDGETVYFDEDENQIDMSYSNNFEGYKIEICNINGSKLFDGILEKYVDEDLEEDEVPYIEIGL